MREEGSPSALRAAVRLAWRRLRSAPAPPDSAAGPSPRRRLAVERTGIRPDPRRVGAYLEATRGSELAACFGDRDPLLPPVFPAVWETALVLDLLADGGFPFPTRGLVHLGGETVQLRPLKSADRVRCRVELDRVDEWGGGLRLSVAARNWNGVGQLCCEDRIVFLLRVAGSGGVRAQRTVAGAADVEPPRWQELDGWTIRRGQGRRYARASGDYNPIHLWSWSSRPFGYPTPILQGYCLQAMVAHALILRRLGGDPAALRRLQIEFRAPLPVRSEVRLLVAEQPGGTAGRYRVVGRDGSGRPFAEGSWVGAAPSAAQG